eukprot:1595428-Alexandrium_andersonii.AAC.1
MCAKPRATRATARVARVLVGSREDRSVQDPLVGTSSSHIGTYRSEDVNRSGSCNLTLVEKAPSIVPSAWGVGWAPQVRS